jgi:photosystem II stability/assembly factor-like uncharacterized protein
MKIKLLSILLIILFFSCKPNQNFGSISFENPILKIDTLYTDNISIRAIMIDQQKVWFAANNNKYGFFDLEKNSKFQTSIFRDSLSLEFRSIAQTNENIFILSVGNPALLFKISKSDYQSELVYKEKGDKVFYDSMQFWSNNDGIAIGDPTSDCFSILITHNGGNSWKKLDCSNLPKLIDGEAAFAASNSNVICKDSRIFIVSGGKKSRIFVSDNEGFSWKVYDTPIIQGEAMTGIFSADFFNKNIGFAVGGNYENQTDNSANKAITTNGGKTWRLSSNNEAFGYASCVQFLPKNNGKTIYSVGTSGLYFSTNKGEKWKKILDDKDLFTIRFQNESTLFAAGKNKLIRINLKK